MGVLGETVRHAVEQFDTFPKPDFVQEVTLTSDEFTSLCPVTGQPDFCTVTICYRPGKVCIESKSLKLYLWQFREEGVFCEALSSRICADVWNQIAPFAVTVTVEMRPRGGVAIRSEARRSYA